MYPLTVELLHRVGAIVKGADGYFGAAKKWYGDSKLAVRHAKTLLGRSSVGAKVDLLLNGRQSAGGAIPVHAKSKVLDWTIEARLLSAGRNRIDIAVEGQSDARLYLKAATVLQENGFGKQRLDLTVYQPRSTPPFALDETRESQFDGDVWRVPAGGNLSFRLDLESSAPVSISLELLKEDCNASGVLKEIAKRVRDTRAELAEQRSEVGRINPNEAGRIEDSIDDLDAYLQLQSKQIEPAFLGGEDQTLDEVIARVGNPDRLIEKFRQPVSLTPLAVAIPLVKAKLATPVQPNRREIPKANRTPRPPKATLAAPIATAAKASGLGILSKLLLLVVGSALIVSGFGYAGWSLVKPMPIVFESPVDGQAVAANAPLQVWISATDPDGVKSLTLTAVASEGANVTLPPQPLKYDFPNGTRETTSKVFTIQVGALTGAQGKIVLTATAVNGKGKTTSQQCTVKVGGTESDLGFELNPVEPKPMQTVVVTVAMLNAKPGSIIKCHVVGTDGYDQTHRLTVDANGKVKFDVPGAKSGVVDSIDAEIEGTPVRRRVTYRF